MKKIWRFFICWLFKNNKKVNKKLFYYFQYVWNPKQLESNVYLALNLYPHKAREIISLYRKQCYRIKLCGAFADREARVLLLEAEKAMAARRSLKTLRKQMQLFAKEMALNCGYAPQEIHNKYFFCPGSEELWHLYERHSFRITGRERTHKSKPPPSLSSAKEKNAGLFAELFTQEEVKKKYRRLCKLNHPDVGGSAEAMKRLNELYEQALARVVLR